MASESTVDWEKDIYANGMQINTWPYSDVVSAVLSGLTPDQKRQDMKFLEMGCGTGNNLWFALKSGFQAAGIDGSSTAISYARDRLAREGYANVDLRVGNFAMLPWENEQFDIVIDRAAITHNTYADIRRVLQELHRVMKPGGRLYSFTLFGLSNPDRALGKEVAPNTYDHFSGGFFAKVGRTSFFDADAIDSLFGLFKDVSLTRHIREDRHGALMLETYSVSCRK